MFGVLGRQIREASEESSPSIVTPRDSDHSVGTWLELVLRDMTVLSVTAINVEGGRVDPIGLIMLPMEQFTKFSPPKK
jgi:hypothetical protein